MTEVPIPRTIQDPKYRYKMPLLQQRIEGKGINTRTNLTNLRAVAQKLRVPVEYILRFISYDLGSRVDITPNQTSVRGEKSANDMLEVLDRFIDRYVLCPGCKYPELIYSVPASADTVLVRCNACGKTNELDKQAKLTGYIIKNPPKMRSEMEGAGNAQSSDFAQTEKQVSPLDEKKVLAREALRRNPELIPLSAADKPAFDAIEAYLAEALPMDEKYDFDDAQVELVYKAIKRLRLGKPLYDRVGYLLFAHLFDANVLRQVDARSPLFEEVLRRHKMEEFLGHELVLNLQVLFYAGDEQSRINAKFVPSVMKKFYDQGILKEEFLKKWRDGEFENFFKLHVLFDKDRNAQMVNDAAPFLNWLDEEEEEEDEEDENENENAEEVEQEA